MCDLTGFNISCNSGNTRGILKVEYMPVAYVDQEESYSLRDMFNVFTGQLVQSGDWLHLPVLPTARSFNLREQESEQGTSYELDYSFEMKWASHQQVLELQRMTGHRFLLRVTHRDKSRYTAGEQDKGLDFSFQLTSGTPEAGGRATLSFRAPITTGIIAA